MSREPDHTRAYRRGNRASSKRRELYTGSAPKVRAQKSTAERLMSQAVNRSRGETSGQPPEHPSMAAREDENGVDLLDDTPVEDLLDTAQGGGAYL